ncbi:hypothetical protein GGI42DRAFT_319557 [Trichoderma sp. SZMC 28013]
MATADPAIASLKMLYFFFCFYLFVFVNFFSDTSADIYLAPGNSASYSPASTFTDSTSSSSSSHKHLHQPSPPAKTNH